LSSVTINGNSIGNIADTIVRCFPREVPDVPFIVNDRSFVPMFLVMYGLTDTYSVVVKTADGATATCVIDAVSLADMKKADGKREHIQRAPISLKLYDDLNIGLITLDVFRDDDSTVHLLEDIFSKVLMSGARHLIIDLRENPGGNSEFGDMLFAYLYSKPFTQFSKYSIKISETFLEQRSVTAGLADSDEVPPAVGETRYYTCEEKQRFPSRGDGVFDGPVYVLIDANTASSALSFSAMVRDYERGYLVGQTPRAIALNLWFW